MKIAQEYSFSACKEIFHLPLVTFLIGSIPQAMLIIPLIFLEVALQNKYWNVSFLVFFEVFSLYNWRGKLQLRSSAWVMYCYTPKWNCMFMMTVKFTWEVKVKRKV